MTTFEARWKSMPPLPDGSAFQRVDDSHPLDFYLGRDASGEWILLLITGERAETSREHQAIHVICGKRADGRWALMFRLMRPELGRLFSLLCEDLVEAARGNPDPARPASFVLARFARWQRLLERGHSGLLDDAALRGLLGELVFLEQRLIPSRGIRESVIGWVGPTGADRDFRLSDQEVEIKTIRPGADCVRVSSAEQLDLQGKRLDLAVVTLDDAPPNSRPEVFTPLALVTRLREIIAVDPVAVESFDARLMDAGFVLRDEYGERAFAAQGIRTFTVGAGFPAILRSNLPAGIGKVAWELQLQAIQAFESGPIGG